MAEDPSRCGGTLTIAVNVAAAILIAAVLGGCVSGSDNTSSQGEGSVTVSWTAPSTRANGEPISLSDIGGYELHYGRGTGRYGNVVTIENNGRNRYTIEGLRPGSYFLAMRTVDTQGASSAYSAEVRVTVE